MRCFRPLGSEIKYSNSSENLIISIIIFLNLLKYSDIISVSEMYQQVTVNETNGNFRRGESYMEEKAKKILFPTPVLRPMTAATVGIVSAPPVMSRNSVITAVPARIFPIRKNPATAMRAPIVINDKRCWRALHVSIFCSFKLPFVLSEMSS